MDLRKEGRVEDVELRDSLGSFHNMWITKAEYEEHGAPIVNKTCP